jgi:short-subunit dehydrogenase
MLHSYKDRVAVVTGAARGLGRALAAELAARGCRLALIDIDCGALEAAAQELGNGGAPVTHHCVDVSSAEAVEGVANRIAETHGAIDLLINNAAVSASASFANTGAAEFERILRVNFLGLANGCRAFLPWLQKSSQGQILNVCSCFAWCGYPRKTAYAASKGAIRAFSESLRLELAGGRVGVTLLYPGPVRTSIAKNGISDSKEQLAREEKFLRERGLAPDRAARLALDQLQKNPPRIVIGLDYRLFDLIARLSPRLALQAMDWSARRFGF